MKKTCYLLHWKIKRFKKPLKNKLNTLGGNLKSFHDYFERKHEPRQCFYSVVTLFITFPGSIQSKVVKLTEEMETFPNYYLPRERDKHVRDNHPLFVALSSSATTDLPHQISRKRHHSPSHRSGSNLAVIAKACHKLQIY